MTKRIEYTEGENIGELTFVREADPYVWGDREYRRGIFICGGCDKEFEASLSNVRTGNTTRCRESANKLLRLPEGEATVRDLYGTYKWGAKRRDIEFDLDYETFRRLTQQPCTYCGQEPASVHRSNFEERERERERGTNGSYTYNGVDRVDNDKGYCCENCITCCKQCNFSKSQLTVEEFLSWVEQVTDHQISKQYNWWGGISWAVNLLSEIRNAPMIGGVVRLLKGLWKPQSPSI